MGPSYVGMLRGVVLHTAYVRIASDQVRKYVVYSLLLLVAVYDLPGQWVM